MTLTYAAGTGLAPPREFLMRLHPVPVADVAAVWPVVASWVSDAVEHAGGWWSANDVKQRLERGDAGLWLVMSGSAPVACVVSEIETGPQYATGVISICAGDDMDGWLHLLPQVETWARASGARVMEVRGREGWKRALRHHGYSTRCVVLGKELG